MPLSDFCGGIYKSSFNHKRAAVSQYYNIDWATYATYALCSEINRVEGGGCIARGGTKSALHVCDYDYYIYNILCILTIIRLSLIKLKSFPYIDDDLMMNK